MKLIKKVLNSILVIKLMKFKDKRGYFTEVYNQEKFDKLFKKKVKLVQDNISLSRSGTIRGLHYQIKPFEQGKLVTVIKGKIFDVAVDIRKNSKSYGKYFSIETIVKYNTSKRYSPKHERTLLWNDKKINIKWPDFKTKTISMKDSKLISNKYD